MKGTSTHPTRAVPSTPSATAPDKPTTTAATSWGPGMRVASGRPCSSSSAWAATPTARKKARTLATRREISTRGASAAPITT